MKLKLPKVPVPKFNTSTALKVIVIIVAVLGLTILGTAVGRHWQEKQTIKTAQVAAQREAEAKAARELQAKLDHAADVEAKYNKLYVECAKGENLYGNVLTAYQKNLYAKSKPVCGAAEIPKI